MRFQGPLTVDGGNLAWNLGLCSISFNNVRGVSVLGLRVRVTQGTLSYPAPDQPLALVSADWSQRSSILFGDTMVPMIEEEYIPLLGYSILYKEYNLTRFNHQKTLLSRVQPALPCISSAPGREGGRGAQTSHQSPSLHLPTSTRERWIQKAFKQRKHPYTLNL